MTYNQYPTYYRNQVSPPYAQSLTNQVPYLVETPGSSNERFFLLPFVGGLALGGLLFNNRPCGGYGCGYPTYYQPYPYPYPYPYQQNYYQQMPYQQQQQQQSNMQNSYYGPYTPSMPTQNETTVLESNKYYIS
ncbi:MAG: hypothetical protein ACRCST_06610 [Turicibacter sp.]